MVKVIELLDDAVVVVPPVLELRLLPVEHRLVVVVVVAAVARLELLLVVVEVVELTIDVVIVGFVVDEVEKKED